MRLARTLALLSLLLIGCGESAHDDALQSEFDDALILARVGLLECVGTMALNDIPIERDLLSADALRMEYDGDDVLLTTQTGRLVIAGTETGQGIVEFSTFNHLTEIEAYPPIPYDEIYFQRMAHLDGPILTIEDRFDSDGDDLACWHQFTID